MALDIDSVPGWFFTVDQTLFDWFLAKQGELGVTGDLAELGTFLGKSAIVTGSHLGPDDVFTVVDLFEDPAEEASNRAESVSNHYSGLTQRQFEANYRGFHDTLPTVVRGFSQSITTHARHGTHRWVHVDASHLYDQVAEDIKAAQVLLRPDGLIVLDDICSPHTPGVWAAAWEAVLTLGLKPIIVSRMKLYATWGDADAWQQRILADKPLGSQVYEQQVLGARLLIAADPESPTPTRKGLLLHEYLPPAVVRPLLKARAARKARSAT